MRVGWTGERLLAGNRARRGLAPPPARPYCVGLPILVSVTEFLWPY